MSDLPDIEVVIQNTEGLFLYRDGKTFGNSPLRACKYLRYEDDVEEKLQQVRTELGMVWQWIEYDLL